MSKTFPPMTFSELLEKSGLSANEAGEHLGVSQRTVYRWINGESKPQLLALKQLRALSQLANSSTNQEEPQFTFIDLFAGIGGFRKSFDSIGGKCVFTSEWDKACRTTYTSNYLCDHAVVGDIREYTKDKEALQNIPAHDVLLAGFPCQPFSIAGVSKKNSLGREHGFRDDTQGTLFFDLAQIIDHHQPSVIVLENVKNLVSHDKGNTFKVIKRTLEEELGYHLEYKVIDAKGWVPQHRERIFIIGFKKDFGFRIADFAAPETENKPTLAKVLHHSEEEDEIPFFENGKVNDKYTLTDKLWQYLQDYKKKHQAKGNGFGFSMVGPEDTARTLSARYYKDGSEILIRQEGKNPRRLTPRECARLMGFDGFGESGFHIPVSDTQAYKQFGNSVAVPVVKALANELKPYIVTSIADAKNQLQLPFEHELVKV